MSSIFGRLDYNFDSSKFGSSLYLTEETKKFINLTPIGVETWQINDIANGNIQMTNYYKNPLINVISSLNANVYSLQTEFSSIEFFDNSVEANTLNSSIANLKLEIVEFQKHTNNISGVSSATSTTTENSDLVLNYPDYDSAVSLGQQLLLLLNASDNVQNSTPILGSMTSLFIEQEMLANTTILVGDKATINNSLRYSGGNVYSNLTSTQVNVIIQHVQTANTLISERRNHDWNFYRNGLIIIDDYNKVEKLTRLGNTQTYLVNNLIGTDRYKNNLSANT